MIKRLLIFSFDLIRKTDLPVSLSIASLLAYLKQQASYGENFCVEHHTFNLFEITNYRDVNHYSDYISENYNLSHYQFIALSCYVWSEFVINDLIRQLRAKGFSGKFILGGYQISYTEDKTLLSKHYPDCQHFISGYGEAALLKILTDENPKEHLVEALDFESIPSPYLTNVLVVPQAQKMVRMETKRGCPFRCSFCAHRDLIKNKVHYHVLDKVFAELDLFNLRKVEKINVLDPIFNMGTLYIEVLQEAARIQLGSVLSLQSRFELIKGEHGKKFITLCEQLNVFLEFGLQTAIEQESIILQRRNNMPLIKEKMEQLNTHGIAYEITLIYGLPGQTLDSFQRSIDFAYENGAPSVKAYPLMLLRGTELFAEKERWGFQEENLEEFDIPVVVSSHSFSKDEWLEMRELADKLSQMPLIK